jgi:hypothetical protein
MSQWKAPALDPRWVGIATDAQAYLAAVVSSHLSAAGKYFALFEFPSIPIAQSTVLDYTADGAFAQLLGRRSAGWINNALAAIQPERILLLGLTEEEKSYLVPLWPAKMLSDIQALDQIDQISATGPSEPVSCQHSELGRGLLRAKSLGRRLVIDEAAMPLPSHAKAGGKGLVVIEADGGIADLIAVNYAFSIEADAVFVPAIDRHELDALPRQLQTWSSDRSSRAFDPLRQQITHRIKDIDFSRYEFVTFFTAGLPYGLVLKNAVPCTHAPRGPYCGAFVAHAIAQEHRPITFDSALVFSPQLFASEETADIASALDASHINVMMLLGSEATLKNLDHYGALFPYDVMHICSHGGETDGYHAQLNFVDRVGQAHGLEYYEVVGFSPAPGDMVHVETKAIFTALDGFAWRSDPLKAYPKYVFEDMFKALKEERGTIVRTPMRDPIALSCHIQCSDSIHQGAFQMLAAFGRPLIFNNTCSSNHQMAETFIPAGARAYIGTLWAVGNTCATQAARTFYAELLKHGSMLRAFTATNRAIKEKQYRDVYIFWGLHFSTLPKPDRKSDEKLFAALIHAYVMWLRKTRTAMEPDVKRNSVEHVEFLRHEIFRLMTPERLQQLMTLSEPGLDEETEAPLADDDVARGPNELVLRSEVRRRRYEP